MSILKDFKEFKEYRKNKKNMYFSNKLYIAELGHFCVRSEMTEHPLIFNVRARFRHNAYVVVEELSVEETKRYLRKTYGISDTNLPKYHGYNKKSIKYYRIATLDNKVVPLLSATLAGEERNGMIEAIVSAQPITSIFPKTALNEQIDINEVKEIEYAANRVHREREKEVEYQK